MGHAGTVDSTHSFALSPAVDYTYSFSAADLAKLAQFINNGGDFAFGFNPDCHYFDTSVTMQITLGNATSSVPEPMSILLLGTVALVVTRQMRRKGFGKA